MPIVSTVHPGKEVSRGPQLSPEYKFSGHFKKHREASSHREPERWFLGEPPISDQRYPTFPLARKSAPVTSQCLAPCLPIYPDQLSGSAWRHVKQDNTWKPLEWSVKSFLACLFWSSAPRPSALLLRASLRPYQGGRILSFAGIYAHHVALEMIRLYVGWPEFLLFPLYHLFHSHTNWGHSGEKGSRRLCSQPSSGL